VLWLALQLLVVQLLILLERKMSVMARGCSLLVDNAWAERIVRVRVVPDLLGFVLAWVHKRRRGKLGAGLFQAQNSLEFKADKNTYLGWKLRTGGVMHLNSR
jgi:hypothetical protein